MASGKKGAYDIDTLIGAARSPTTGMYVYIIRRAILLN